MSDAIKHECGIALIRLLKPLEYYTLKYGTPLYGLNKLYLLMEKQHNRGQDGAGIASVKFDTPPGTKYINRKRSNAINPIKDIFTSVYEGIETKCEGNTSRLNDAVWLKNNAEFVAETYMGHLRYGTFGKNDIEACHPFLRENNWRTRNLAIAGNFNLTNVDELIKKLLDLGQHPVQTTDTVTVLEKIGHFLDKENQELFRKYKDAKHPNTEISTLIAETLNIKKILANSSKYWDGGYVITGLLGHGDAFVLRDPNGIRPAFFYQDDEIIVVASERPAIQTALNVGLDKIKEIDPGHALIIRKNGAISQEKCNEPKEKKSCSFERIYFSRGTDTDIYKERKMLGKLMCPAILEQVDYDIENTVFSYIPNTANSAFFGLIHEIEKYCNKIKTKQIIELGTSATPERINEILSLRPRFEKCAVKDAKLRTFITQDTQRDDLVAHVYDITYGSVIAGKDNLVVLDDSIVRGTTLKQSIIRILDRLGPKKIIIASSAPQIRYPDCYGIDMTKLGDFIAFKAAIQLLKDTKQEQVINEVYKKCKEQENKAKEEIVNYVKEIYAPFTAEQISNKISLMLTPAGINAKVQIMYQTIENLHAACPQHLGDWYFTGNFPTPGGNKVVNTSFINYIEGKNIRAY